MPGPAARADGQPDGLIRALVIGLVVCLVSSCSSSQAQPPGPVAASTSNQTAAQVVLDSLAGAVLKRDRGAFDSDISDRDPGFGPVASRLFDNLTALPITALTIRLRPRAAELSRQRRDLLGSKAYIQQVAVEWRLKGDVHPAEHLPWFTFLPEKRSSTIAGTKDGPPERVAQPLWSLERIGSQHAGGITVVTGQQRLAPVWIRRGQAAASAVTRRLHSGLGAWWIGELVIEVPTSRQTFESVLGVAPGSYSRIAAVAWPEGPDAATAATRIVVNPELSNRLDDQALAILLTHEATHVATRSAVSPAPSWLVEGFADYVAYDAYPGSARAAAAAVVSQVRTHGSPAALPSDAQFSPSASDLDLTYAEAWLACRFLADHFSPAKLDRFYLEVDSGATVDRALRSAMGSSEAQFTAQWRRSLEDLAGRV